jgi:hypothetical protein
MEDVKLLRSDAQLAVRPHAYKLKRVFVWLAVDQHQVGFDVAVTVIFPFTDEFKIQRRRY